jgi:hypothetical protein
VSEFGIILRNSWRLEVNHPWSLRPEAITIVP